MLDPLKHLLREDRGVLVRHVFGFAEQRVSVIFEKSVLLLGEFDKLNFLGLVIGDFCDLFLDCNVTDVTVIKEPFKVQNWDFVDI